MKKYIDSERVDLFEPNIYIAIAVTYHGSASPQCIVEAVKKAYTKNESTMSRIVLETNGNAFYERMDQTGCKVQIDDRDYLTILLENEQKYFALWDGEMIRTFVIPGKEESTIFIMAQHLVGDGQSILLFIRDIADCIAGKDVPYKPLELVDSSILAKKFKMPLYIKAFVNWSNYVWDKKGKIFDWEDYRKIHREYWKTHQSLIEIEEFKADEIKSKCPQGVTINTYLLTKIASKYPKSKTIGIPISIRGESKSMSNQTSGTRFSYSYNDKQSFSKNLEHMQKKIEQMREKPYHMYRVLPIVSMLHPSVIDGIIMSAYGIYNETFAKRITEGMQYSGKKLQDLGVTNLMRIEDIPGSEEFEVSDILFIPPKVSYSKEIMGIGTYGNRLHISYHKMIERNS